MKRHTAACGFHEPPKSQGKRVDHGITVRALCSASIFKKNSEKTISGQGLVTPVTRKSNQPTACCFYYLPPFISADMTLGAALEGIVMTEVIRSIINMTQCSKSLCTYPHRSALRPVSA
ncbi:hypothetical protein RRG08_013590 [Elysia crispata]|uniref:Uncharacterized protein n=1 Tax=Elysia crispata TaxID=231223 RepID=A0AAE0Y335_9GAST|nr:hypothetical protein RRG08_013590 [Elysia crispata]